MTVRSANTSPSALASKAMVLLQLQIFIVLVSNRHLAARGGHFERSQQPSFLQFKDNYFTESPECAVQLRFFRPVRLASLELRHLFAIAVRDSRLRDRFDRVYRFGRRVLRRH